jgi:arylsulfatase A-like enzyme
LSKGRFWEESARVPLVIRWPGRVKTGRTGALAQLFDVYPTIGEAIGGEASQGRFARSLLPVATGKAASVRDIAISEIGKSPPLGLMVRHGCFKWWAEGNEEFLFDIKADPLEQRNLAASPEYLETLHQMREEMLSALRSTQVNLAAGSKSKVQRIRESAAEKEPDNQ